MITSDTKVFEQLFQTYYSGLVKFCRYFIEDLQEAEDLVVDIFVKIWFKYNTEFCCFADPKGYLFRAAYNECMLHLKKRTRTNRKSRQYFEYIQKPIHENQVDHENQTNILKEVEKLPPRHKTIIELYYFKKLTLEKIAEELNIPLNTVKSHKSRAESRIAKHFLKA
ncbi:RNA polymerase sigma factor [Niastella sp. OAS944]|uniref:RNA polymerase sigma factor n=1 Tax=Niastella sp. OAS944 TaxID=2664089 RepID=UPI003477D5F1|nr:RNA polymerase sigma-70 factor (ECF subfamily) [Chitinophagaceae bacterium OAS944]